MKMVSWQVLKGRYIGSIHVVIVGGVPNGRHMRLHDWISIRTGVNWRHTTIHFYKAGADSVRDRYS